MMPIEEREMRIPLCGFSSFFLKAHDDLDPHVPTIQHTSALSTLPIISLFFSLGQGQKGQEQYINRTMNYQYIALDLSVLVLVCVFVFVVVLPVFVSLSSFMFLSLSLPLFLFLSCSGSCLSPCLCYCSRLCLCPRPCCCLCLIVPLLFFPAHQPVGGHEAALEHRI